MNTSHNWTELVYLHFLHDINLGVSLGCHCADPPFNIKIGDRYYTDLFNNFMEGRHARSVISLVLATKQPQLLGPKYALELTVE
jgi:hypothetical protein